jgi:plastocyanin
MRRIQAGIFALVALALGSVAHAATFIVNVGGNAPPAFSPQIITIAPGDTVTFVNKGGFHNVVADDGSFTCAHGCKGDTQGDTGAPSSSNWIFSLSFATAGTVGYYCVVHGAPGQGMYGTINVRAPQPPPATSTSAVPEAGSGFAVALVLALAWLAARGLRRRA